MWNWTLVITYTRKTSGPICSYKEDSFVLSLPKILNSSCIIYTWPWNLEDFLNTRKQAKKKGGSDQFFHPTSYFSGCRYPCLFYYTSTEDVGMLTRAFAEIFDHTLFTFQFCYIEKLLLRSYGAHAATSYMGPQCLGVVIS